MPELKQNRRYTVGGGKWAGLTFADEAARTSFEPLATGAGVIALQQDTGQYFLLESVDLGTPPAPNSANWAEVSIAPAGDLLDSLLSFSTLWNDPAAGESEEIAIGDLPYNVTCVGAWINIVSGGAGTGTVDVLSTSGGLPLATYAVTAVGTVLDTLVGNLVGKVFNAQTEGLFLDFSNNDSTGTLTLLFNRTA